MSPGDTPQTKTAPAPCDLFAPPPGRTLIMGVLNVTPDSFFDGGRFVDPAAARRHAEAMIADGAHIIDVGGESSRPGARPIGPDAEWDRVGPVLDALEGLPAPISVDTWRAATARRALDAGAAMINDITACRRDPAMAETLAERGCPCVLMHMRGTPETMQEAPRYDDVTGEVRAFFEERLETLARAGVRSEQCWLDPGFGFGKTVEHNLTLLRELRTFKDLGRPLLVGASNKSTIGAVLDLPVNERAEGTAATVAVAIWNGADAVRVHDARAMARVARMTDAIAHGRSERE